MDSIVCGKCGAELSADARFCLICGTEVPSAQAQEPAAEEAKAAAGRPRARRGRGAGETRGSRRKPILAGLVAVLLAAAALIAAVWVRSRAPLAAPVLYLRDGETLCLADMSRSVPRTSALEHAAASRDGAALVSLSPDNRWIVYAGASDTEGFALYRQAVRSGRPLAVAAGVTDALALRGGAALYLDAAGALKYLDAKGNEALLDEGVEGFFADAALETAIWLRTEDGERQMFALPLSGGDRVRVAHGFDSFIFSPDGKSCAFLSGDTLSGSWHFAEAAVLDEGVSAIGCVLDNGDVYYERPLENDLTLYALLDDDLALADAAAQMGSGSASEEALERDALRETLREARLSDPYRSLRRCDRKGAVEELGCGALMPSGDVLRRCEVGAEPKQTAMSEFYAGYAATGDLERALFGQTMRVYIRHVSASTGYFLAPEEDGGAGWALYSYPVSRGPGRAALVSDRVRSVEGVYGNDVWYLADFDGETAALCRNDETLARGVAPEPCVFSEGRLCCFTDWNGRTASGTLLVCDGKTLLTAAENVSSRLLTLLPDAVYFTGADGVLRVFDGRTVTEISGNVADYRARDARSAVYLGTDGTLYDLSGRTVDRATALLPEADAGAE